MGQPTWLKFVRNVSRIRVQWDADYPFKLEQVGCLTQVGWKSPFHACANMFDGEITYDLLLDNGRQLRPLTHCTVAISVPLRFLYRNRTCYGSGADFVPNSLTVHTVLVPIVNQVSALLLCIVKEQKRSHVLTV